MPIFDAFQPAANGQVTLSVTNAAQFTAITSDGESLELYNPSTTVTAFFESCGPNGTAAVATSYPVGPGQCKIIKRRPGGTGVSYIGSAAGPTTMYVTAGNGI